MRLRLCGRPFYIPRNEAERTRQLFIGEKQRKPFLVYAESIAASEDWLSKFGYLPPPDPVTGQLQTKEALTKAIKAMQKYGGLKETGVLDQATLGLMKTPRCSLPDVSEAEGTMGRRKRDSERTGLLSQSNLKRRDDPRRLIHLKVGKKSRKMKRDAEGKQDIRALED
ncbi:hypothetical protein NQZ68_014349 [Dissostichus eleginoides]|nr:hypothetical protein NQZ68_014349 [Dissostichus eleginoides]